MHEAFFFGPDSRRIFGSYHPPVRGEGSVLIVLCPPLFLDYTRTQAALRRLATALAEQGQHVLRFDYRGTGDSSSDLEQVTIDDWLEDVALAVSEGRELSGARRVRLLGVRAGALLAARVAGRTRGGHGQSVDGAALGASGMTRGIRAASTSKRAIDIDRLVLWDPVFDGPTYLKELRAVQSTLLDRHFRLSREQRLEAMQECAGHRVSERLLEQLRGLTANVYGEVPSGTLQIVRTAPGARLPGETTPGDIVAPACEWQEDTEDVIMVRPLLLERLAACLTRP